MKNNVLKVVSPDSCCGCGTCEAVCPKHCIQLKERIDGFLYPKVNETECIECGLCVKECPELSQHSLNEIKSVYAACCLDLSLLKAANSGGVFSLLALWYIENKHACVCGAAYTETLEVEHVLIDSVEGLKRLQGSKYVQSKCHHLFPAIKEKLQQGQIVLFSGTGCQTSALCNYLGKEYDNLLLIELVCHGVPSPGLFRKYIHWLEQKEHLNIEFFKFRNKLKRPTGEHGIFTDGNSKSQRYGYSYEDPYYGSFLAGRTLRSSCFHCKFRGKERCSDLTLGDFWGIEKTVKDFPVKNGTSLVMVNSVKGKTALNCISDKVLLSETSYDFAVKKNPSITNSADKPLRSVDYYCSDLFGTELAIKCSLKNKIKSRIPWWLKTFIKRYLG